MQALIASPGPDSARLAPVPDVEIRLEPMLSAFPLRVTPPPSPLPAPTGSWLEQQLQRVQDALASGRSASTEAEAEARALKAQIDSIGILGGLDRTLSDVHRAGQLQQMLPIVVLAIGVLMGRPMLGASAAAAVWVVGRDGA